VALSRRLPNRGTRFADIFQSLFGTRGGEAGQRLDAALERLEKVTQGYPQLHQSTHLQGGTDAFPAPGAPVTIDPNQSATPGTQTNYARSDHRHGVDLKLTTKGDSLTRDGSGYVREAVGADGTVLAADSTQTTGRLWRTVVSLLGGLLTTKGDLVTRDGTTVVRKGVGTDAFSLTADSAQADGLRWGPIVSSPAQITGNVNDYAPGVANVYRLDSDAARSITGLVAGAAGAHRRIYNVGGFNITLTHEDALSSANNRFLNPGAASVVLAPNEAADLFYDGTTLRWRVLKL